MVATVLNFQQTMELPFLLLTLSFLLSMFIIVVIFRPSKRSLNLPPGPSKLPIIGSLHHLLIDRLPHRALGRLARAHGPVMLVRFGQVDTLVISSQEAAKEVMKSQDLNFCTRPEIHIQKVLSYGWKDIAFAPYSDHWRQLRKICSVELLSSKRVHSFHSIFEQEISRLIADIDAQSSENKPVNLSAKLVALTNTITSRCVFGNVVELESHQEEFIAAQRESLELMTGFNVVDLFPHIKFIGVLSGTTSKVIKVHRQLDKILKSIIIQHQVAKRVEDGVEDLVDVLLRMKDHGQEISVTDDSIKAVVLDLFGAGSETISTIIVWAMSELMRKPKVMEKATDEVRRILLLQAGKTTVDSSDIGKLHYLKLVIKETLRLHPPSSLVSRQAIHACQVDGYNVPAGTRVFINVWALGRDPLYWGDDAEEFKPERFSGSSIDYMGTNFEFVPFGAGRRMCPGIAFGTAAVELTLARLLLNFDWKLSGGVVPGEIDMTESTGATVSKKTDLCLFATQYSQSDI